MAKLVTGGTGHVGSEIVRQLVNRDEEVVAFDIVDNRYRLDDIEQKVKFVRGDLGDFSEVLNVVRDYKVDAIYHTGSMLNFASRNNPAAAFRTNVLGTHYVFEAARLFNVTKMMFASSRGSFGLGVGEVMDDWTIQRPASNYGCAKLYGEGIGRFYRDRFGLDFRSVRYATIIVPGDRIHGSCAIIEDAILGKHHFSDFGPKAAAGPFVYVTDAAKSAIDVLDAPEGKIQTINYNVTGTSKILTARELEAYLKERYPGFQATYKTDVGGPMSEYGKLPEWVDSYARKEWGWKPELDTLEAIVGRFERDVKEHPKRFNITL